MPRTIGNTIKGTTDNNYAGTSYLKGLGQRALTLPTGVTAYFVSVVKYSRSPCQKGVDCEA